MRIPNLTGQTIGFWKVGEKIRKNGKIYYHCTCTNCGTEKDVYSYLLYCGKSQSCGCAKHYKKLEDFTGKRFGMLVAKERVVINKQTYWNCLCDCGNTKIVRHNLLKQHVITSCGCRGTFKENVQKVLEPHCYDGTYIPGISRNTINRNNSTGIRGVSYRKDRNKYRAYIKFQRKTINLGYHDTLEEAAKARRRAEEEYFQKTVEEYKKSQND